MNIRKRTVLENEVADRVVQYLDDNFRFQKDVAEAIGSTQVSLSRMMNGKQPPSIELIKLLIDNGMNYNWAKTGDGDPDAVNKVKPDDNMIAELKILCVDEQDVNPETRGRKRGKINDPESQAPFNNRLRTYINTYVSENQTEAANILGLSQTSLSRFFNGKSNATARTIQALTKHGLNLDWASTGNGSPKKGLDKKADEKHISEEVMRLQIQVKLLKDANDKIFKFMKEQADRIAKLEAHLRGK